MKYLTLAAAIAILAATHAAPLPAKNQKGGSGGNKGDAAQDATMPTQAEVENAAANFKNDATTVSASLNNIGDTTDATQIKLLATEAFNAENDEDAQRAVLFAAAGPDGSDSNDKIVQNTPAVLDGLAALMSKQNAATVLKNLQSIEDARNPNILPSITQLSNSALTNVGSTKTQVKFPTTNGLGKLQQQQQSANAKTNASTKAGSNAKSGSNAKASKNREQLIEPGDD